ncbi:MAG: hypothetical protein M3447_11665 [Acidobacteriota bacterium]|nr:hypothetical protein [Acidobacteriota bacterium]
MTRGRDEAGRSVDAVKPGRDEAATRRPNIQPACEGESVKPGVERA